MVGRLTLWEYQTLVEEHNDRQPDDEQEVAPWTPDEYYRAKEELMARGDPAIRLK